MSEYKPNQASPIFGEKGFHAGDTAEDMPGTAEQKAREEREKARAEKAELDKKADEEKKLREQEENSYINGDFQTLFGFGGNKVRPEKRLLSDVERLAASLPEPHPMEATREDWKVEPTAVAKPEVIAPNVIIPESHPMEMTPEELEAQVEQQVDKVPEKTLERQVAAAAPKLNPEQTKQVVEELQKPENKAGIIKRMKDKIGAFAAGGAGGYAGSMVARVFISTGIRSVFGTTLGVGIAAGAIAGGSVEGVKSYLKERNKFSADDIITRLDSSKSEVERAVVISEANKALQEARISHPERVPILSQKIQEAQVVLEAKIKSPEFKNESEKNKIAFILKTSETARDNINREQKREIKALIKEIKFKTEKSEVDWNKVMKSTGKGALVGALGGALGGMASGWIAEHLGHSADDLAAIHAGHVGQAYSSAIEGGRDHALNGGDYVEHVLAGDKGLTEEARKAVHDYMINLHSLGAGQAPDLSTSQYIYAEDWLVKNALDHGSTMLHPGDVVRVPGEAIQHALEHAQNLSQDQLANITEMISHQPHLISQHTADWLNNFDYANPENGQAVASLLQGANSAVEYTISSPAYMEAAAWASGALTEASYQMGREATHFLWHMAGKDADAEARGISDLKGNKTISPEQKDKLPVGTFFAEAGKAEVSPNEAEASTEVLKAIDLYKDLKIKAPRNLSRVESAALGFDLLKVLITDPEFSNSSYYATLKKTKFSVGISSSRNKEGVVVRKTGLAMYIDTKKEFTLERAQILMDSLKEKLVAAAKNETTAPAAKVENSPESNAEKPERLPQLRDLIRIRRDDGSIVDDCMVVFINNAKKEIRVVKQISANETLLTGVSFKDYQELNKSENTSTPPAEAEESPVVVNPVVESPIVESPAVANPSSAEANNTPASEEEANIQTNDDKTNKIEGNPNIKARTLNANEAAKLEDDQETVSGLDLAWPGNINEQAKDSFKQDLIGIAARLRTERSDLLPFLKGIKLDLAQDNDNVLDAGVKRNANGRYNVNTQAPMNTIYAELLPVLEDLQRTANPA